MFSITFPVRYYEADPMGVVHHSEYIRYFELARNRWLHEVGYSIDVCNAEHLVFPVVHIECDYRKSDRFGFLVTATCRITGFTGARVEFEQTLLDEKGDVCASGRVVLGFLDTVRGTVRRCPEKLAGIIRNEINTQ